MDNGMLILQIVQIINIILIIQSILSWAVIIMFKLYVNIISIGVLSIMATINLLPDATLFQISNNWTIVGSGGNCHNTLRDDETSNYLSTTSAGTTNRVGFDNMSVYHGTINSIRLVIEYRQSGRGSNSDLEVKTWINWDNLITNYNVDTESEDSIAASGGFNTIAFTTQTDYNDGIGTLAWSTAAVNGVGVSIECDAISGGTAHLTYAKLVVDYDVGGVDKVNGVAMSSIDTVNGVSPENFDTVSGVD
jgi:hypothetical protein